MDKKVIQKVEHNGVEIIEYSIKNDYLEIRFLNVGGAITKIALAVDQYSQNLVVNYDNLADYLNNSCYLNALVGRTSNRIKDGKFMLNGKEFQVDLNDGPNNLHGGVENLTHAVFDVAATTEGYHLQTVLPDQPKGFPGNIRLSVYYLLDENKVKIIYEGSTDKETIFNPTQHAYFNLSGNLTRTIYEHELTINSEDVAEVDANSSFTEKLLPVAGTRFDFTKPTVINPKKKPENALFDRTSGYDHLFILSDESATHAATFSDPKSGRKLEVFTTEPAMQFYAGNYLDEKLMFENGRKGEQHLGACFETHKIPFDFKSQILTPDEIYTSNTTWVFSKKT